MVKNAVVSSVEGNFVILEITRREACAGCNACGMFKNDKVATIKAPYFDGIKVGDRAVVKIIHKTPVRPILLLYAVPLVAFLLGTFLMYYLSYSLGENLRSLISVLAGFIAVAISYFFIRHEDKKGQYDDCIACEIEKIIKED